MTPTLCTGSSTAKLCHRRAYQPSRFTSSATIASARRSNCSRAGVTSPMMRTASPGPGKPVEKGPRGAHDRRGRLRPFDLFRALPGLTDPKHAIVDENPGKPVANRSVDNQRRPRRIDAAAECAHDAPAANLRGDLDP